MNKPWVRRRWMDFRQGHSTYLLFILSFSNFVLIFYRLLVEQVEFLDNIFSELWVFGLVFILLYIPIAVVIGLWHRKTQVKIESDLIMFRQPFRAIQTRVLMDLIEGKADMNEVNNLRKTLISIENGRGGK